MNRIEIIHRVPVALGARSYNVVIGRELLANTAELIRPFLSRNFVAIVTDSNVAKAQLSKVEESLRIGGINFKSIILPAGEATKSYQHLAELSDSLLGAGVERRDIVIALGGGVIGD